MEGQYISVDQLTELRHRVIREKNKMDISADRTGMAEQVFNMHIKPIVSIYNPVFSELASHNSNFIYRARKCINNKPFDNIKDLYNPPAPSGRALATDNIPILYASSSHQTCLSEIDVKIGDLVNIAAFQYTNIANGKYWFIGQLGSFYKSQEQSRYLRDEKTVTNYLYVDSQRALNSLVYKDLLINEIFSTISTQTDDYVLNRYLMEDIRNKFNNKEEFYGVVFISARDAPGVNFAIYGKPINELEPAIVNLVRITDIDDYGNVGYELLKNCKPKQGVLEWPEHELQTFR